MKYLVFNKSEEYLGEFESELPVRIGESIEMPSSTGAEIFLIKNILRKKNGMTLYVEERLPPVLKL